MGADSPAALTACLRQVGTAVPSALERYEQLRGGAQRERDRQIATEATDWSFDAVAWIYEHDAAAVDL